MFGFLTSEFIDLIDVANISGNDDSVSDEFTPEAESLLRLK